MIFRVIIGLNYINVWLTPGNSYGLKFRRFDRTKHITTVTKVDSKGDTTYVDRVSYKSTVREYYGDLIKENNVTKKIYNEAGYIEINKGSAPTYHYYVKDYLGSIRAVVDQNGNLEQANDYYPSGLPTSEYGTGSTNDRLHNGKEFSSFSGLYMYDNEARHRDPIFNRFTSMDPMAEKYPDFSPYVVCGNNLLNKIDPDGMDWYEDPTMKDIKWDDNAKSQKDLGDELKYIGNDKALLKHLNMSYNFPTTSSNKIGYVAFDSNVGMHMINVKEKSNVSISINTGTDENMVTENNKSGKIFNGVNVTITNVSSNSGTDGELNSSSSSAQVIYGNETFTGYLSSPEGDNFRATGTSVTQSIITIPSDKINTNKQFSSISVSGSWWVNKPEGRTPVTYPGGIIPLKYTHKWTF